MIEPTLSVQLDRKTVEQLEARAMANAVMYEKELADAPLLPVTREVYQDSAVFWRIVVLACRQTLAAVEVPA